MRTVSPAEFEPAHAGPYLVVVGNLNALRCVGSSVYPVLVATSLANRIARYSRFCRESVYTPSPTRDPESFVDALVTIGEKFRGTKAVIYYDGDADLQCVSRNRERLAEFYEFLLPDAERIESYIDKELFAALAGELDLPVPVSMVMHSSKALDPKANELRFPVIVKPMSRVGWLDSTSVWDNTKGAKGILAESVQALDSIRTKWESENLDFIVQELIPGPESSILSYHAYVGRDEKVLGEYTGRKHRTYPTTFGRSSCIEVEFDPEVANSGHSITKKLGLKGVFKLDFKRDPRDGRLYLLEVNSRFSIWNYSGSVAGVNLLLIAAQDLLGHDNNEPAEFLRNVKWIDAALDRKSLGYSVPGYLVYIAGSVLRSRTTFNTFKWSDPRPFIANIWFALVERVQGRLRRQRPVKLNSHTNER